MAIGRVIRGMCFILLAMCVALVGFSVPSFAVDEVIDPNAPVVTGEVVGEEPPVVEVIPEYAVTFRVDEGFGGAGTLFVTQTNAAPGETHMITATFDGDAKFINSGIGTITFSIGGVNDRGHEEYLICTRDDMPVTVSDEAGNSQTVVVSGDKEGLPTRQCPDFPQPPPVQQVVEVTPGVVTVTPASPGVPGSVQQVPVEGVICTTTPLGAIEGPVSIECAVAPATETKLYVMKPGVQTSWSIDLGIYDNTQSVLVPVCHFNGTAYDAAAILSVSAVIAGGHIAHPRDVIGPVQYVEAGAVVNFAGQGSALELAALANGQCPVIAPPPPPAAGIDPAYKPGTQLLAGGTAVVKPLGAFKVPVTLSLSVRHQGKLVAQSTPPAVVDGKSDVTLAVAIAQLCGGAAQWEITEKSASSTRVIFKGVLQLPKCKPVPNQGGHKGDKNDKGNKGGKDDKGSKNGKDSKSVGYKTATPKSSVVRWPMNGYKHHVL